MYLTVCKTHCCVSIYRVNDVIVSVNGVSTVNVTHGQAVEALKRAGNVVSLVSIYNKIIINSILLILLVFPCNIIYTLHYSVHEEPTD